VLVASLTIRDLDHQTKERLRVRAARRQRSMEEEARHILREAVAHEDATPINLAEAIGKRFRGLGAELEIPEREPLREPPTPET
jgi:plasmid stability protein